MTVENDGQRFRSVAKALTEQRLPGRGSHLTPATIEAYRGGILAAAQRDAVQEHLALCAGCTQSLLARVEPPAVESRAAETAAAVRSWPAARARLLDAGLLAPASVPVRPVRGRSPWLSTRWGRGLAAALVLALAATVVYLALQLRAARSPHVNVAVLEVPATAELETTRGADAATVLNVSRRADRVVLVLRAPAAAAGESCSLAIFGSADRHASPRWRTDLGTLTASRRINLELPAPWLADGDYVLRVVTSAPGQREVFAEYPLRVVHEP